MGDLCIEVEAVDDALIEGDEDFQVSIANPGTTTGSDVVTANPTIVVTTITDNDAAAFSLTGDPTVAEGADAKYVLALSGICLLYTSPSPRDLSTPRMPSSA